MNEDPKALMDRRVTLDLRVTRVNRAHKDYRGQRDPRDLKDRMGHAERWEFRVERARRERSVCQDFRDIRVTLVRRETRVSREKWGKKATRETG